MEFFFKGIRHSAPPPGKSSKKGSQEYPEWRRRAIRVEEFDGTLARLLRFRVLVNGQVLANTAVQLFIDGVLSASRNLSEQISVVVPDKFHSINTLARRVLDSPTRAALKSDYGS